MTATANRVRAGRDDWANHAECAGILGFTEAPLDFQVSTCDTCPVVEACLDLGAEFHRERGEIRYLAKEVGGVFGGLTPDQLVAEIRSRRDRPRTTKCLRCNQKRASSQFPSGGSICGTCPQMLPDGSDMHGTARGYLAGCECGACMAGRPLRAKRAAYLDAEVSRLLPRWRPDLIARHLGYGDVTGLLAALTRAGLTDAAMRLRCAVTP